MVERLNTLMGQEMNADTFRQALVIAVEDRGADFRYTDLFPATDTPFGTICLYHVDGHPACIIGYAGAQFDWPSVLTQNNYDAGTFIKVLLQNIGESPSWNLYTDQPQWVIAARSAQLVQDNVGTWGEALAEYDRVMTLSYKDALSRRRA